MVKCAAIQPWVSAGLMVMMCVGGGAVTAAKGLDRAVPVVVATAAMRSLAPMTQVPGLVISRQEAVLSADVAGRIVKIVAIGTPLQAGQVVAEIDDTFVKFTIDEYRAEVEGHRARFSFLKEELKRLKRLVRQNNASKTQIEQMRTDSAVARASLDVARSRLRWAQEQKQRHLLRAPFNGVVVKRLMQRGERVKVGDNIARLVDPSQLEIRVLAPLSIVGHVARGDTVAFIHAKKQSAAVVSTLVPLGSGLSRLIELRMDVPASRWVVGQAVRVVLPMAKVRAVLAVPRDALVLRRDGASVFRINADDRAEKMAVSLGVAAGAYIEVRGGLQAGDRVVVRGGERLRHDQRVKILQASSPL